MNDKFEKVLKRLSFSEAEDNDLFNDASLSWQQRLEKVQLMTKKIWTFRLGKYPTKIEFVGGKKIKANTDSDDF